MVSTQTIVGRFRLLHRRVRFVLLRWFSEVEFLDPSEHRGGDVGQVGSDALEIPCLQGQGNSVVGADFRPFLQKPLIDVVAGGSDRVGGLDGDLGLLRAGFTEGGTDQAEQFLDLLGQGGDLFPVFSITPGF